MAKVQWIADTVHTVVGFQVKHLMISNVKGTFSNYNIDVTTVGDDFGTAEITFSADLNSISTGDAQRDGHLRSADFFDADKYPQMTFKSTRIEGYDGHSDFKIHGDLTIRGQAYPVELNVEMGGIRKDPWGNTKAGFTITGKVNRKAWGLVWNAVLEGGGFLVGEEVKIIIDLELQKQVTASERADLNAQS
jgi:polyisoprenoid-binding protein YceI